MNDFNTTPNKAFDINMEQFYELMESTDLNKTIEKVMPKKVSRFVVTKPNEQKTGYDFSIIRC